MSHDRNATRRLRLDVADVDLDVQLDIDQWDTLTVEASNASVQLHVAGFVWNANALRFVLRSLIFSSMFQFKLALPIQS